MVDSNWTPGTTRYPPAESSQVFDFAKVSGDPGWTPTGVDSQKNRPVASEVPGLAPLNKICAQKDP